MTRAKEIGSLRARYATAVAQGKRKTASLIFARLSSLVARQLKAEAENSPLTNAQVAAICKVALNKHEGN